MKQLTISYVSILVDPKDRDRAIFLVQNSVKKNTIKDYQRYIDRWVAFLNTKGFNSYENFDSDPPLERTTRLILLICFMDNENNLGRDYNKAMSALRFKFKSDLQMTNIFDDETLKAVKKSLRPSARELYLRRTKRTRLPTPYVFILWLRSIYWESGNIEMMMTYLGIAISYNYGLRSSEYTHDDKNKGEHAIRASDVFFVHKNGQRLFPWQLNSMSVNSSDIISGKFSNISGKTRTDGNARDLFLARTSKVETQLLEELLHWCKASGVKDGDIFFARYKADTHGTIRRKQLIPKMVSCALKEAAIVFELPPEMFSTHCNRIGCASDLRAYGESDDDISRFIGWTSDASLLYQRGSSNDPSALRAGASGGTLSISDIANLVPTVRSSDVNILQKDKKRKRVN